MSARTRWLLVGLGLVLVLTGLWYFRLWPWQGRAEDLAGDKRPPDPPRRPNLAWDKRPPDPRLAYQGPFKNIDPKIQYVGDAACAACHKEIADSYHQHPMGRSLAPMAKELNAALLDEKYHNPFLAFGSTFRVEQKGGRVWNTEQRKGADGKPIYEFALEAHFVVGSGNHSQSFLTNRDGFLYETPITWYSKKEVWDLSPGFGPPVLAGRPVIPQCLFCHCNKAEHVEGSVNKYQEPIFSGYAIGCERCHGPGGLHVAEGGKLDPATRADYTIVNPRHLPSRLKESICEQCHLDGVQAVPHFGQGLYDFRPGMPLEDFQSIFVDPGQVGQERKIVNHVEQMYLSKCYQNTAGADKLQCISCHNPHGKPAQEERVPYFRQRCLACHGGAATGGAGQKIPGCALPPAQRLLQNKQDSCIDCHMPTYPVAQVDHFAFTDHRILRDRDKQKLPPSSAKAEISGLVHFHQKKLDLSQKSVARDYGVALMQLVLIGKLPDEWATKAPALLSEAVTRYPGDWEAWEAKGQALYLIGQSEEALATFQTLLDQQPQRETALVWAAMSAQALGSQKKSLEYWFKGAARNPWNPEYQLGVAVCAAQQSNWPEAKKAAELCLKLNPGSVPARKVWITCLLHDGDLAAAEAEFAAIRALAPPNLPELEAWFKSKSK